MSRVGTAVSGNVDATVALELLDSLGSAVAHCDAGEKEEDNVDEFQRCRPQSLSDYTLRLRTFVVPQWFNRPLAISPIKCARRGWINTAEDIVECRLCRSYIEVERGPGGGWIVNGTRTTIDKYNHTAWSTLLVERHSPFCPWRSNDATIADPMYLADSEIVNDVRRRLHGLQTGLIYCPLLVTDISNAKLSSEAKPQTSISALEELARAGWEFAGRDAESEEILRCVYCDRHIGVQCFKHRVVAEDAGLKRSWLCESPDSDVPPTKVQRLNRDGDKNFVAGVVQKPLRSFWTPRLPDPSKEGLFDPHAMHRFYCPMYSSADDALSATALKVARCCVVESLGAMTAAKAKPEMAHRSVESTIAHAENLIHKLAGLLPPVEARSL
eukprot:TRINITY_DN62734_c0_g1_i1.p1 TRINITY_DN62734_c0_g1~~TRINITY_DN62734_c0_g1_i1.p1  ORF type:complete len:384 (+),score=58.43 TRINITY_DN62734_c0_g1_i1:52-1203(+)